MPTGQTPAIPEPPAGLLVSTEHDATSWNVHRHTLVEHSHSVAGIDYVGAAGMRLDDLLRASWRNEAYQLVQDLVAVMGQLNPTLRDRIVLDITKAAEAHDANDPLATLQADLDEAGNAEVGNGPVEANVK